MKILESILPSESYGRRNWSFSYFAHAFFYALLPVWIIFTVVAVLVYDHPYVVEVIPATSESSIVIDVVQEHLKTKTYRGYQNPTESLVCWDTFADKTFTAAYLSNGWWRVSAFYSGVRYYWRVNDLTMEIASGRWFAPQMPTIGC